MEQQAKQRLTGGVILVVLLVLLVPELLTGPRAVPSPTPAQPDEAPMRSYTMDLGDSPHANGAPVAPSTAVPTASEPIAPVSRAPAPVVASQPAPRVAAKVAPVIAAPAASSSAPRARATPATATPWTVQLGTFGKRENAARLVTHLKSHGFSGSISEATKNGHKLFRVRVGAEPDRAAAQKLLARLRAAGVKGGEIASH